LEAFELADDQGSVGPRTGIGDVEVVAAGFWGELAAFLNKVSELRLSSFELACFVAGRDPICDLSFGLCLSVRLPYPGIFKKNLPFSQCS
jgi:hypothetical protein